MQRLVKYFLIIGLELLCACMVYYFFIKFVLEIRFSEAIPLVAVGVIGFTVGCIYYIRKERQKTISKKERAQGASQERGHAHTLGRIGGS